MLFSHAQLTWASAAPFLSSCATFLCSDKGRLVPQRFLGNSAISANLNNMLLMIDYSNFVVHITLFISQQVLLVIIKAICY